mgnify:FL=1|jgi:GntR family transcriptional regulator, transcriptional repressor for pyruvate dehydrogenase complex
MDSIRSGRFAPGDQLPAERQLCEEFGVARTSVREAIQQLISLGVVERHSGRLHVVKYLGVVSSTVGTVEEQIRELFETRRVIEISLTELAACRSTDHQREKIHSLAHGGGPDMELSAFRELDHRFHAAIAGACGNTLMAELYERVLQALFSSPAFASLLYTQVNRQEVRKIIGKSMEAHRQIAQAILSGDAVQAAAAAAEHLAEVERRILGQLL